MERQTKLSIDQLTVEYRLPSLAVRAIDELSCVIEPGERVGIVGESGSGKTTLAMSIMGLLHKSATVCGSVYCGNSDLFRLSEAEKRQLRWNKIAIAFQNSLEVLNPVMTVKAQIGEAMQAHTDYDATKIDARIALLLEMVGLPIELQHYYPHQISGGMRQRVILALALSCDPEVLIVDEPTNALDAITKNEIVELIEALHGARNFTLVVVSHEVAVIARLSDRLLVMQKGRVLEEGPTIQVLQQPRHAYTRGLFASSPEMNPFRDMWGFSQRKEVKNDNGCVFAERCAQQIEICRRQKPALQTVAEGRKVACHRGGIITVLQALGVSKTFQIAGSRVKACDDCSLHIRSGEVRALIGQSGSGKTTLGSIICGVTGADTGRVLFLGEEVKHNNCTRKKNGMQIVFQDPYTSINELLSVADAVREPLEIVARMEDRLQQIEQIKALLQNVQLPMDTQFLARKCLTLSGGQRQRLALARALAMDPVLLIADEITSMLDPSTQANILRLLKQLQNQRGFSMLYITHDLAVARKIADEVSVMQQGKLVEQGNAGRIFSAPAHAYTQELVAAALGNKQFC
jgi:peptide/nickel transport system ATP-binding protein